MASDLDQLSAGSATLPTQRDQITPPGEASHIALAAQGATLAEARFALPGVETTPVQPTAPSASPPARRISAFAPLRRRNFSLLFSGQVISMLGDQAYGLALPWTVLAVTGDPRQVGIVLAAATVPRVALLLFGGALADRLSPRVVMIFADLMRVLVVGALGVTLFRGLPPLWIVAILAGLEGAGTGLFQPGSQALLPKTVSEAELPAGNGLMMIIQFLSLTLGPLLGGVATAAEASFAFLADAASFGVSALTLFGIRLPTPRASQAQALQDVETDGEAAIPATPATTPKPGIFKEIGAGFRYALTLPLLRTAMIITIMGNFAFAGALNVALIVLSRALSPSPVTLAYILMAGGVGGIIGGLSAGLLSGLKRRGIVALCLWVVIALLLMAMPLLAGPVSGLPTLILLPLVWRVPAVALALGLSALLLALTDTMFLTVMQQVISLDYMARVFSIQFLMGGVSQPLSLVLAGIVSATWGSGAAFIIGGAVLILGALYGLASPALRRL